MGRFSDLAAAIDEDPFAHPAFALATVEYYVMPATVDWQVIA